MLVSDAGEGRDVQLDLVARRCRGGGRRCAWLDGRWRAGVRAAEMAAHHVIATRACRGRRGHRVLRLLMVRDCLDPVRLIEVLKRLRDPSRLIEFVTNLRKDTITASEQGDLRPPSRLQRHQA